MTAPLRLATALCLALSLVPASAETAAPQPPYVAAPPAKARWTIAVVLQAGPAGAARSAPGALPSDPGLPRSVEVLKWGDFRRVVVTGGDGAAQAYDHQGPVVLSFVDGLWRGVVPSPYAPPYPLYSPGFFGTDWVGAAAFRDVAKYQGKGPDCFHYVDGQGREAWIDAGSALPVAVRLHGADLVYAFSAPPPEPPALDPAEAVQVQRIAHPPEPAP